MFKKPLAIVALSGGLDSATCAAIAAKNYELAFLHLNYGNRTNNRELEAFHDVAKYYLIENLLVTDMDHLRKIGGSSLTDKSMPVDESGADTGSIPDSYVPFRNANILAVAVSWGEVIGAEKIFVGMMEEDSSGYPDCREEFVSAFNAMVDKGTKPETKIEIVAPLIHMTKAEVVKTGITLHAPFALTWSCYQNEEEACGVCESCRIRLRGFNDAGEVDPIKYSHLDHIEK